MTDGVWAYIWSEGQNTGLKFKILESGGINEEETGGYVDIGEIEKDAMNVDCKPAVIPDSMLTLPSNVEFTDLGELMRQMQELVNKTGGKLPGEEIPDQCSFCDMIPTEDAKEECLKNCQTA